MSSGRLWSEWRSLVHCMSATTYLNASHLNGSGPGPLPGPGGAQPHWWQQCRRCALSGATTNAVSDANSARSGRTCALQAAVQNAKSSAQIQNLCRVLTPSASISYPTWMQTSLWRRHGAHHQLRAEHPAPQNVTAQRLRKRSEMQRSASLHTDAEHSLAAALTSS